MGGPNLGLASASVRKKENSRSIVSNKVSGFGSNGTHSHYLAQHTTTMASSASSNDAELGRTRPGGDTATSHGDSRPLRLRVRKIEASYLAAIESGAKLFDITQQRYLGTAHGWTLGWELRTEVQEELWIGLSPVGMFAVTHFACLEACDTLDGVACWADCARLHGSGISVDQAMKRDQNPKTALDATKQTYAWRFKSGSIHKLREPAEIEPFCGPWGEASLRGLDYADTPLPMYDQMTLSLVPRRTSRKRAARQLPAVERRRDVVEHAEEEHAEEQAEEHAEAMVGKAIFATIALL